MTPGLRTYDTLCSRETLDLEDCETAEASSDRFSFALPPVIGSFERLMIRRFAMKRAARSTRLDSRRERYYARWSHHEGLVSSRVQRFADFAKVSAQMYRGFRSRFHARK